MQRSRFRPKTPGSRLETRFLLLWRSINGLPLEREFRFHPGRRWRADFAHLPSRSLIEIEGGIWVQGGRRVGTCWCGSGLIEIEGGIWVQGRHNRADWREARQISRSETRRARRP